MFVAGMVLGACEDDGRAIEPKSPAVFSDDVEVCDSACLGVFSAAGANILVAGCALAPAGNEAGGVAVVDLSKEIEGFLEELGSVGFVEEEPNEFDFVKRELLLVVDCGAFKKEKASGLGLVADLSGDVCIASSEGGKTDLFFSVSSEEVLAG